MKISFHNHGEGHNFWQNYTDLMSGLMIIFLLASLGYLVSHDSSRKIKAIYKSQKELCENNKYFRYNEKYQIFECKIKVQFKAFSKFEGYPKEKALNICSTIPSKNIDSLITAGKVLKDFIDKEKENYDDIDFEIIIDGRIFMSTGNGETDYTLSYKRALSLYNLWKENNIFDNQKDHIHFAGSGNGGIGQTNTEEDRRFIIQVIPYIKTLTKH